MPPRFDGDWLREHFPDVAESMDRFIDKVKAETQRRARRRPGDHPHPARRLPRAEQRPAGAGTSRARPPAGQAPVFLLGDSAIGSPYFQSISLGLECAFFLAGHIANRALPIDEVFERYETFMYQQWLRVYMRTQMIKHNKDLLESVDDTDGPAGEAARLLTRCRGRTWHSGPDPGDTSAVRALLCRELIGRDQALDAARDGAGRRRDRRREACSSSAGRPGSASPGW